jgi:hypothetical protein
MDAKEINADREYLIRLLQRKRDDIFIRVIDSYSQSQAQERYDKAVKHLEENMIKVRSNKDQILIITDALLIASGFKK